MEITKVTAKNVEQEGLFCIKNQKNAAYSKKIAWFKDKHNSQVVIQLLKNQEDVLGFIEYTDAENAWRPIKAPNYLFIHCITVASKKERNKNLASALIKSCEDDAKAKGKVGVCVMTSKGSWLAEKKLYEKNDFIQVAKLGRFELLYKSFDDKALKPEFINWKENQKGYQGWHLLYSNQCPWHFSSVEMMSLAAKEMGIDLQVTEIKTPQQAQNGPSGYGTFAILHDNKLLEDHYLSQRRFETVVNKELKTMK